jgi:hypothetical protein
MMVLRREGRSFVFGRGVGPFWMIADAADVHTGAAAVITASQNDS